MDVHYADSVRAKAALDAMMDGLAHGTPGLWVRSVPVKEKESINRKAVNDYKGEVRRYDSTKTVEVEGRVLLYVRAID